MISALPEALEARANGCTGTCAIHRPDERADQRPRGAESRVERKSMSRGELLQPPSLIDQGDSLPAQGPSPEAARSIEWAAIHCILNRSAEGGLSVVLADNRDGRDGARCLRKARFLLSPIETVSPQFLLCFETDDQS